MSKCLQSRVGKVIILKNILPNLLIFSKDEAKLVFKDIYRLYNEDIIFLKKIIVGINKII
jgi:hypothetical protein